MVGGIQSPETWDYRFLSAADYESEYGSPNPFNSLYVLQWYDTNPPVNKMIVPNGYNEAFEPDQYEPFADGFALTSNLGPVDGPYANLWFDQIRNIGDPPLPGGGPIGGGTLPYHLVPEIPGQGLAALGCLGFALLTWLRRRA